MVTEEEAAEREQESERARERRQAASEGGRGAAVPRTSPPLDPVSPGRYTPSFCPCEPWPFAVIPRPHFSPGDVNEPLFSVTKVPPWPGEERTAFQTARKLHSHIRHGEAQSSAGSRISKKGRGQNFSSNTRQRPPPPRPDPLQIHFPTVKCNKNVVHCQIDTKSSSHLAQESPCGLVTPSQIGVPRLEMVTLELRDRRLVAVG